LYKTPGERLAMLSVMPPTKPIAELYDADLRVTEDGEREAPAVLLLTNAAAPAAIWDPVVPALAGPFHVIRVDLLGQRRPAAGPAGGYSVENQARRIAAALERLGVGRVTVIGHSSGCMVATSLAEQTPEAVVALALIDMGPTLDAKKPDGLLFHLLLSPLTGRLLWRLRNEATVRKSTRSSGGFTRPVDIPDSFVEHSLQMTYRDFSETMRAYTSYLGQRGLPDRLTPLGLPVLVVFGTEDLRWRPSSAAEYGVVPGARVELLPGVGHTPMMEDPETTGKLLLNFAAAHARAS
jgi:pimeloyl-ACP methyl ester carboxylesterase